MIEKHTMSLTGTSGENYNFIVFPIAGEFEKAAAVYFVSVCKPEEAGDSSFNHSPVFVGQTEDLAAAIANHPKAQCFELAAQSLKATKDDITVGSMLIADPARREHIYKDLEGIYKWVCNHWTP